MKLLSSARLSLVMIPVCLFGFAQGAGAADELLVYAFEDGQPLKGATVSVDGSVAGVTQLDGSAQVDLQPGRHAVVIEADGQARTVRLALEAGQLADVAIDLAGEDAPYVEVYSSRESSSERRGKAEGVLQVSVTRDGIPVEGVVVNLSNGGGVASSNTQGVAAASAPRGRYTLTVDGQQFDVRVFAGVTRGASFELASDSVDVAVAAPALEEVFVLGSFDPTAFEVSERDTDGVVDTIGVELLSRYSDSDVAASVARVPGISIQDNKYVFIRGLGGRYVATTLNNATMPSTNPSKRTVPLDLFPSNVVNQLDIKKTFLPYMPGESTGGNLVVNTKTFPDDPVRGIMFSIGGVSDLTSNQVATDPLSGGFDYLGWDDGERGLDPGVAAIAEILSTRRITDSVSGESYNVGDVINESLEGELRRVGAILIKDGYDADFATAHPDASVGVELGDLFYVADAEVGFYAAANYSNQWSQRERGERNSFSPVGGVRDRFNFEQVSNNIEVNGLLSAGLIIGDSTFEWNTFLSRDTSSMVERSVGIEGDESQTVYSQTTTWIERQYASTQLLGTHFLTSDGGVFAQWQLTASQAQRIEPGRRDFDFTSLTTDAEALRENFDYGARNNEQSIDMVGFTLEPGTITRRYDELIDNNIDASLDVEWDIFDNGVSFSSAKFGFQAIARERDSDVDVYGFNLNQAQQQLLDSSNVSVGEVVYVCGEGEGARACANATDDNGSTSPPLGGISNNRNTGVVFDNKTLPSDSYEAELEYNSVYAMYDHTFNSTWQVVVGARYEMFKQTTDTFELRGAQQAVQSVIDEDSLLPSLGLNWFYSDTQQLRFAVSETVARPDFKEASNAVFYDNEFNFRVRGNPFLEVASVRNADLRWEWYPDNGDNLSIALFYKELDKPIERVVQIASGTVGNSRSFRNSESGELAGVEFEGRQEFQLGADSGRTLFVAFNATLIDSEVRTGSSAVRELQGQPEHTGNLILGFDDFAGGHELTLLLNQNGRSIADVGLDGAPDVFLEPREVVNLVYRFTVSDALTLRAKVDNILNAEYEYTQFGTTFQRYEEGTKFSVTFDWDF